MIVLIIICALSVMLLIATLIGLIIAAHQRLGRLEKAFARRQAVNRWFPQEEHDFQPVVHPGEPH